MRSSSETGFPAPFNGQGSRQERRPLRRMNDTADVRWLGRDFVLSKRLICFRRARYDRPESGWVHDAFRRSALWVSSSKRRSGSLPLPLGQVDCVLPCSGEIIMNELFFHIAGL